MTDKEQCPCCGYDEVEYTCDICGNNMCSDCTRNEYVNDTHYFVCEDCYNNGEWGEFEEQNKEDEEE